MLSISCRFSLFFLLSVCQINGQFSSLPYLPTPTPPPVVPAFSKCPQYSTTNELWVTYLGSKLCYWYSTDAGSEAGETVSYHSADDICRKKGSSLASIHDFTTNYILSRPNGNYNGLYWIGLTSLYGKRGIYQWTDATPNNWNDFANTTASGDPLDRDVLNQVVAESNKGLFRNIGKWFKSDCNVNRRFICQRPSDPSATPAPPPKPTPGGCPLKGQLTNVKCKIQVGMTMPDWYKYGDEKCVKYMDTPLTFANAKIACDKSNAELMSIHSQIEEDFITTITAGLSPPYIGLQYKDVYVGWSWEDQSRMTFTSFGVQDPDKIKNFTCGVISTSAQPGQWLKVNCEEKRPFLCQTQQDPKRTTGMTLASKKCTIHGFEDYFQYRNSCYSLIDNQSTHSDFSAAEKSCQAMNGAHLISIVDSFEESFLRYYLWRNAKFSKYWIGLHSEVETNANDSKVFEWTDGWPMYYMNWAPLEPLNPSVPQSQCTYHDMNTGTWMTSKCDQSLPYVCKISSDSVPHVLNVTGGVCPKLDGITDPSLAWVNLHKGTPYCYWFSTERKLSSGLQSWSDASYHCRRRNGTLVSIHSDHEMAILMARLKKSTNDFISWIGLYRNPIGKYVWDDGSALDYLNGLEVPSDDSVNGTDLNDDSSQLCAELRWDSTWNWSPCAGNKRNYFVCQTSKIIESSLPVKPTFPTIKPTVNPTIKPTTNPTSITTTNPNVKTKSDESPVNKGLSTGAKTGIAFGAIAGVAVVLVIGFLGLKRYRPNSAFVASFENSLYRSRRNIDREPEVTYSSNRSDQITSNSFHK